MSAILLDTQLRDTLVNQFKGLSFQGQTQVPQDTLASRLRTCSRLEHSATVLTEFSGHFAGVFHGESYVDLVTDQTGSIPLYYGYKSGRWVISEDAQSVMERLTLHDIDLKRCDEFGMLGYTTGQHTLVSGVWRVPAGHIIRIQLSGCLSDIAAQEYFSFKRRPAQSATSQQAFETMLDQAVGRMKFACKDRTVFLPLSGGYDSRLVAIMVHRAGLRNVTAFCYGPSQNDPECAVSKRVADAFGFKWIFIPYTDDLLLQSFSNDRYRSYLENASGLSAVPHLQDWPALNHLYDSGQLSIDAIIMPGHGGDILAGHRIATKTPTSGRDEILDQDYNLRPLSFNKTATKDDCLSWVENVLQAGNMAKEPTNAQKEYWTWRERLSKFLIGGVKAYEAFDCCWWLPLLDVDVVAYMSQLSDEDLRAKGAYKDYVNTLYAKATGDAGLLHNGGENWARGRLKIGLKALLPKRLFNSLRRARPGRQRNHFFIKAQPNSAVMPRLEQGYLAQGIMAEEVLEHILLSIAFSRNSTARTQIEKASL